MRRAMYFWNPAAISYLAELLLALVFAGYLTWRVSAERRKDTPRSPTVLLALTVGLLVPALGVTLINALTAGGWESYVMPWSAPESPLTLAMPWVASMCGMSVACLIQFAYCFPRQLPGAGRERRWVAVATAAMVLVEIGIAIATDVAICTGSSWSRPDWMAAWLAAATAWIEILFLRQFISAQHLAEVHPARAELTSDIRAIFRVPASREARAARGFLLFMFLPVLHTGALLLHDAGELGRYPIFVLISWSVLVQISALALVYVSFMPERSSSLLKLSMISLALLLATISGVAWAIAPGHVATFRPPELPRSGQTIRFDERPGETSAIAVPMPTAGDFVHVIGPAGATLSLPFLLSFHGEHYRRVHIGADGTIGFVRPPVPLDATLGERGPPAIYPLLVRLPPGGTRVRAWVLQDRLLVSREDPCRRSDEGVCYRWRASVGARGSVDVHYIRMPDRPRYQLFAPLQAPWLTGTMPGRVGGGAVVRDHYGAFMRHMDWLYAPLVDFMLATVLAVLILFPPLFRLFLVRPLDRLLAGIRRFRAGEHAVEVPVSYRDEIGFITEAFNTMAKDQREMMSGLERMVDERVQENAEITIRNAQLEERSRLSADLHDSVAQTLFSASLSAETALAQWDAQSPEGRAMLERVQLLNRNALLQMRTLLSEVQVTGAPERPLSDLLAGLASSFAEEHGIAIERQFFGGTLLPLPVQAIFFRVGREALHNIAKHSGATRIAMMFDSLAEQAMLEICDNGRGFDPAAIGNDRMGLSIMRDRASQIGATLEISSSPGQGCRVTLIWLRANGA